MRKKVLDFAFKVANQSTSKSRYKVGAVLFRGNKIINSSANSDQFIGYRQKLFKWIPTRHAELGALHGVSREDLKKCILLVVRVTRKGTVASAKPCKACIRAIIAADIKKVIYTNYEGQLESFCPKDIVLKDYCKELKENG